MTPFQLQVALKAHGMYVYTDTGGIYTEDRDAFIGSISQRDFATKLINVNTIRLNNGKIDTHPEYVKALRTVCAINDILLIGLD